MGNLRNIYDILKDAKGVIQGIKVASDDMRGQSLARQSSAATMQFPVIISRSINIETASNVVKALERQYATFVQMVISLNPVIDWDKEDIPTFIQKMHQNTVSPLDIIESCVNVYSNEEYDMRMFMSINEGCNGAVLRSNKEQLFCIEDHLNQNKLNDLYKPQAITMSVAESSLDYFCRQNDIVTEASNKKKGYKKYNPQQHASNNVNPIHNRIDPHTGAITNPENTQELKYNLDLQKSFDEREKNDNEHQLNQDKFNETKAQNKKKNEMERKKFEFEIQKAEAENRARSVVRLADNDVKKCNELVPTTLSVSLQQKSKDNFGGVINFILGVKGIMHPVNSDDMVSNLLDGHKAGNKFFNFLRWTSGEISFIKDLLFNVNGIKEDVIKKHSKGGSHWWTTLKRNRTIARVKNGHSKQKILPNATIVCSMEEVLEMQDAYKVNLLEVRNVLKLMDRYFLLGFAIVDESQELVHFIFDGERDFQVLSFNGLERENNNKNDFKDIYKMINSGRL
jgi:hypothetical protein